ncbi:hypothetical protein DFJ73DRAFT_851983 [Zopfochytrium polystomum]|nr:hypothetical protein DFJ73DRAFT_851983 [Zopfochytrium polystomum]
MIKHDMWPTASTTTTAMPSGEWASTLATLLGFPNDSELSKKGANAPVNGSYTTALTVRPEGSRTEPGTISTAAGASLAFTSARGRVRKPRTELAGSKPATVDTFWLSHFCRKLHCASWRLTRKLERRSPCASIHTTPPTPTPSTSATPGPAWHKTRSTPPQSRPSATVESTEAYCSDCQSLLALLVHVRFPNAGFPVAFLQNSLLLLLTTLRTIPFARELFASIIPFLHLSSLSICDRNC